MKKISGLSPEQENLISEVREEWISLCLSPMMKLDRASCKEGIEWLYEISELEIPRIIFVDSPLACQIAANMISVENQVRNQVEKQVGNQVRNQAKYFSSSYESLWCWTYYSYHYYFYRIGIVHSGDFEKYLKYLKSGIQYSILLKDIIVVSERATFLSRNDSGQLHSEREAAIKWDDGYEQHYINGVFFSPELFNKLAKKEMSVIECVNLENIEQRTQSLRILGWEKVINELGAKIVGEGKVVFAPDKKFEGKEYVGQVLDIDLKDDTAPARFVAFVCPSTMKKGLLRVQNNDQTKTVKGAIAWTFGSDEINYAPLVET